MKKKAHKRSPVVNRAIAAATALLLGGGGLVAVNVYASAGSKHDGARERVGPRFQNVATIDCPEVVNELSQVPDRSRREVDRNLALLDTQVAEAYQRLARSKRQVANDPGFLQNAILGPLEGKRRATIERIQISIGRFGDRPGGLERLAPCKARDNGDKDGGGGQNQGGDQGQNAGQDGEQQDNGGQDQGGDQGQNAGQGGDQGGAPGQGGNGPSPEDFVDIRKVRPNFSEPDFGNGSSGTFTTECGRNENRNFNSDNVIVAPGVSNGAHHMHDYVGNQDNNAFSTNESLAAAETSCANPEDRSGYFWPVLRVQNGEAEQDADAPGGGTEGNVGKIQTPASVTLFFRGNPASPVVAMPRFLRIITGDAKAFTNGDANANASWSCTGFEDRQLRDKYPLCPEGSEVVRTFRFQSCWDGQNIDSANHRTHVAFAAEDGSCPEGFQAIPQMVQRVTYDLPRGEVFAVDSFPEQLHKPDTDHGDFINVMSDDLMAEVVSCINEGRDCQ
ncbi:hypothetical protein CUT44_01715 [Streptomyces carminius]|uniref:DUF1996 domain-containing protein n=1 Tax=Streptomyces carminius TaxID=2665496 RepID=A0A2M8MC91_9ACTN|nr:DUF1996 domain-containing protein [Streptomyces carminius]PJE97992.1 hypothetical protein CUT44_09975 [Streptomyces carminius]PJF01818.1 hypothetical protein CUT44_01715 [Streptomyces carminius]